MSSLHRLENHLAADLYDEKSPTLFAISLYSAFAFAQKQKVSFKDSLDQKFDLSDWALTANGFIPIPSIILWHFLGTIKAGLFRFRPRKKRAMAGYSSIGQNS